MLDRHPPMIRGWMAPCSKNWDGSTILNKYLCVMNDKVITELHKDNLCTYFILPLLKLNKFRFVAESNFVDSFLSVDGSYIYIQVLESLFFEHRLSLHPQYNGLYRNSNGDKFIKYKVPHEFRNDVQLFMSGQFSKMSLKAKSLITKHSGLLYKEMNESGAVVTDIRLLALEQSSAVREMWEDYLDVNLSDNAELLSIPSSQCYIECEQLISIQMTV